MTEQRKHSLDGGLGGKVSPLGALQLWRWWIVISEQVLDLDEDDDGFEDDDDIDDDDE